MDQPRSSDQRAHKPDRSGQTISGRCPECTSGILPPPDDWHDTNGYDLRCSHEVLWHYPRQPWWWHEDGNDEPRQRIFDNFNQFSMLVLVEDIAGDVDGNESLKSPEHVGSCVRRLLALNWQIEMAHGWFATFKPDDVREKAVWRAEIKHAVRIAQLAWQFVLSLPTELVSAGIIDAAARSFEIEQADD
jgi:hypothetical protein